MMNINDYTSIPNEELSCGWLEAREYQLGKRFKMEDPEDFDFFDYDTEQQQETEEEGVEVNPIKSKDICDENDRKFNELYRDIENMFMKIEDMKNLGENKSKQNKKMRNREKIDFNFEDFFSNINN